MIPTHTVPSLSGTFGIRTRLTLNPKMPKEPSSPSHSNEKTADLDKTKISANLKRKCLSMNITQHIVE